MRSIATVLIVLGVITTVTGLSFTVYSQWRKTASASANFTTKAGQLTSKDLTIRGWEKVRKQDYQGAISDFNQALHINPKDVFAYFSRGQIYTEIGDYRKAEANFTQGLRIDPNNGGLHYGRAKAREKLGDTQGAMQDYRQVLSVNPHNSLAYHIRGYSRFKVGNIKGAIEDFEKAKKLYFEHGNTSAYQTMIEMLKKLRQGQKID